MEQSTPNINFDSDTGRFVSDTGNPIFCHGMDQDLGMLFLDLEDYDDS